LAKDGHAFSLANEDKLERALILWRENVLLTVKIDIKLQKNIGLFKPIFCMRKQQKIG
jgi:hypothetical protein